jgi:hypothetical protein
MALRVNVAPGPTGAFATLPLVVWPAPRVLEPGKSLRRLVRLDVGPLAWHLDVRPLNAMTLNVTGVLYPDRTGRSLIPDARVQGARIQRADLLGQFDRSDLKAWPRIYRRALGRVVRSIQRGQLPERMVAARQVASLLVLDGLVRAGQVQPPAQLAGRLDKPVLLRMMIEVLKDGSDVVRAELLAGLLAAPLDKSIVRYLGPPVIRDKSPLVRLRLVELMGAAGMTGAGSIVRVLSGDPHPRVRMMAEGFLVKTK